MWHCPVQAVVFPKNAGLYGQQDQGYLTIATAGTQIPSHSNTNTSNFVQHSDSIQYPNTINIKVINQQSSYPFPRTYDYFFYPLNILLQ